MTTLAASLALSPLHITEYFRDHVPTPARAGMHGYVLRMLADMVRFRGPNVGMCWPAVECLAKMIGRSVRQTQRLIRELEALGEVERIPQRRADGGWSSNMYRLKGLISWASKRVTKGGDTRTRKTPYGKKSNPARGGQSGFKGKQTASQRPALSTAPVAGAGQALRGKTADGAIPAQGPSVALAGRSTPSPAKWRALTVAQVEEARAGCDPVRWDRLRLSAGLDGVPGDNLDAAAAWRWRADAIMRGVQLVA